MSYYQQSSLSSSNKLPNPNSLPNSLPNFPNLLQSTNKSIYQSSTSSSEITLANIGDLLPSSITTSISTRISQLLKYPINR